MEATETETESVVTESAETTEQGPLKSVIYGNREVTVRPTVADAVRELRRNAPPLRGQGLFNHPNDWTQQELDFIADGLKKHVPLYVIAQNVHCERHTLSRLVHNTPELRQLKEDVYEDLWDETIYQTDRLMKAGNASVVIAMWDRLGGKHGFGQQGEGGAGGGKEAERIVMGIIPEEEVKAAEAKVEAAKVGAANPQPVITDPVALAAIEDAVKGEVERQKEALKPEAIDAESVEVGEAPYDADGFAVGGEAGFAVIGGQAAGDPWASGADSPFFQ